MTEALEPKPVAAVAAVDGVTIAGHAKGEAEGRKAADSARMSLKRLRVAVEAERKDLKAPITELGRLVDSEAKRLEAIVAPRESALQNEIADWDAEQCRIRTKRLADRAAALSACKTVCPADKLVAMSDDEFAALLANAQADFAAAEEVARIERERLESERLESERVNREKEAAAKAEQERIAEENRKRQAELDAEQARIDAEKRKIEEDRAELDRQKAEAEKERQRIQREAEAKIEAERVEKECIEAEAEKERKRLEDAALREAQRPDREKIAVWCQTVSLAIAAVSYPPIIDNALVDALSELDQDIHHRLNLMIREMKENA